MNIDREALGGRKKNIISKVLTGVIIGIAVLALFFMWGDVRSVQQVITSIPFSLFLLSVGATLCSYVLRFLKWHFFLKQIKLKVGVMDSFNIFFIGLSMSITPGKVGELLKSYLLKNISGVEMTRSAPAVFVDRLTDLIAMLFLVSVGVSLFSFGFLPLLILFSGLLLLIILLQSKSTSLRLITKLTSSTLLSKYRENLLSLYHNTHTLLHIKPFLWTICLSMMAWFMECISLYILLEALGVHLSLLHNMFIFSFGTIAGALSMIPGGLGIAEGSIAGLLIYFGLDRPSAISATLLIRLVTLWLGVFIGLLIFFFKRKTYMV